MSIADRATISNMCPEYGATVGFFPVDQQSLIYLKQTGRSEEHIDKIKKYLESVRMLRNYNDPSQDPIFSEVVTLDLSTVVSSVSGPKRPHDRVSVSDMQIDFRNCLVNKVCVLLNISFEHLLYCQTTLSLCSLLYIKNIFLKNI